METRRSKASCLPVAWMSPGLSSPEQRGSVHQSLPSRVGQYWTLGFMLSPCSAAQGLDLRELSSGYIYLLQRELSDIIPASVG